MTRAQRRIRAHKSRSVSAGLPSNFRKPIAHLDRRGRIVSHVNSEGAYVRSYLDSILLTEH